MSTLRYGTTATGTVAAVASEPFDSVMLHRSLNDAFAEFYNALFDAACTTESGQAHEEMLELLRRCRADQEAVVEGTCADIALLLADPGGGVVVPISAAGDGNSQRFRGWQRRVHSAFARRCARLQLGTEYRLLLEQAVHRQLIGWVERSSAGGREEPRTAGHSRAMALEADAQQIERLISRLRAGGLKLMSNDDSATVPVGPRVPHADQASADVSLPVVEQVPAPAPARRSRVLTVLLLALAATVFLIAGPQSDWLARRLSASPALAAGLQELQMQFAPVQGPTLQPVPEPAAEAPAVAARAMAAVEQAPWPDVVDYGLRPEVVDYEAQSDADHAPADPQQPDAAAASVTEPAAGAPAVIAEAPAVTAAPGDARLKEQTGFLMRRGDAALAELRLTEPFPDSAAANYLAVLAIDPAHAGARQGLERVVARYGDLVRDARQRGDRAQAERLLARARSVLPQAPLLQELAVARSP